VVGAGHRRAGLSGLPARRLTPGYHAGVAEPHLLNAGVALTVTRHLGLYKLALLGELRLADAAVAAELDR
jgi:hypothetical protein